MRSCDNCEKLKVCWVKKDNSGVVNCGEWSGRIPVEEELPTWKGAKMKLTIECTEEQAQLLLNCLEESFRFRMKQENLFLEHILSETHPEKGKCGENFEKAKWKWYEARDNAQIVCKALMDIIYGKYTTECLKSTHEISDMWRVIRHELYMLNHDGTDFWDVRSDKPIKLSDMPLIKCEVEK